MLWCITFLIRNTLKDRKQWKAAQTPVSVLHWLLFFDFGLSFKLSAS